MSTRTKASQASVFYKYAPGGQSRSLRGFLHVLWRGRQARRPCWPSHVTMRPSHRRPRDSACAHRPASAASRRGRPTDTPIYFENEKGRDRFTGSPSLSRHTWHFTNTMW